jgi:hypothetical protein
MVAVLLCVSFYKKAPNYKESPERLRVVLSSSRGSPKITRKPHKKPKN